MTINSCARRGEPTAGPVLVVFATKEQATEMTTRKSLLALLVVESFRRRSRDRSFHRLEQKGWIKGVWQTTEAGREAKYHSITRSGARALEQQTERWQRLAGFVNKLLLHEP